jgi:hypothetical protein
VYEYKSTDKQSDQQPYEYETVLALLIFMCVYALTSTLFLCYYCMGFSCAIKTKTSPVPNIVPATAPVPSGLSQIVFSPPSTLFSPSTVSSSRSLSSTMFPLESCSEYPSTSSSTYGPSSFMSSSNVDQVKCESYV